MENLHTVKILKQDDNTATVGGYGVVFDGKDLQGDTFSSKTDFMLDMVPQKMVLYDHRLGEVKHAIGTVNRDSIKADDTGLWVEAQIDKAKEYAKQVLDLVKEGVLGYSSGSVPHLIDRLEGGMLKTWPIVEFSLTPTPAEPRTLGVTRIKQLAASNPSLQALIRKDDATVKDAPAVDVNINVSVEQGENTSTPSEEIVMSDEKEVKEVKAEAAPVIETAPSLDAIKGLLDSTLNPLVDRISKLEAQPASVPGTAAPATLKHGRGDSFAKSFAVWAEHGDTGGVKAAGDDIEVKGPEITFKNYSLKASNATDMNIGTAADGGNTVPTGFLNEIIARRDESSLIAQLPLRNIPGVGTTVDVPLDGEADGEFISTAEAATFDQDAPAVGKKSFTLVKYTKYTDISYELLQDTAPGESGLLAWLADFVGRGLAKTYNNLILTEVASNGTSFKTFAANSAIAFGEPEDILGNNDLADYLDEDNAVAWVTRASTFWDIMSIVGSDRQYGNASTAMGMGKQLLGYPVHYSQKVAAIATTAKSIYFGNWRYVGYREAPGLTFLRNPYTVANSGQVRLHWYTRFVAGVLQAEAVGYGEHPV